MSGVLTLLARFRREDEGIAAVEFALVVPFLILLYMGSLEGSALYTADKRVNTISSTIGDLIGQWNPDDGKISQTTFNGYMAASKGLIAPYPDAGVKMVVSMIFVKDDNTANVMWSYGYGGATALTQGAAFPALTKAQSQYMNKAAQGGCVIASQTSYSYKPLLGVVFDTALNLSHMNYFIPRYGAKETIHVFTQQDVKDTSCTDGKWK